jgi:hypothetical protein
MAELNKIVTFRMPKDEFKDLNYLVGGINSKDAGEVISSQRFKPLLDDIQKAKKRKRADVTMGDLLRLGCRILLLEHKDTVDFVRRLGERYYKDLKNGK